MSWMGEVSSEVGDIAGGVLGGAGGLVLAKARLVPARAVIPVAVAGLVGGSILGRRASG
jgi:hypothetical protein